MIIFVNPISGMKTFVSTYLAEYKKLFRLGSPILISQLSVIIIAFCDTLMVGRYSVGSLAASAFVNSIYLIPNVMLMGLASGVTPLVGALYSRGNMWRAGRVTRAALQVNASVALVFTAIMAVVYFFLGHFGQDADLLPQIRSYYLVLLLTPLPIALNSLLMQMSNGVENTLLPMLVTVACIGINVLLNWLLINGIWIFPELGLLGAGIATVTARIVSVLAMWLAFMLLRRYRSYKEGYFHPRRLTKMRWKVWATSWPIMLQTGCEVSLWGLGGVVCGWFGAVQLSAYQVVNTISQLGFMVYISFASAVAIRVAYYSGLRDEKGAGTAARAGLHINLLLAAVASLVFIFGARFLIPLFINTDGTEAEATAVIASALALIAPLVFYQFFDAAQCTFLNAIRGTGQVRSLFLISFVSYVAVGIPMLLLFAKVFNLGNLGAYWSFNISLAVASAMAVIFFLRIRFR